MPRQETVFERDALYHEVWNEPVRKVALRYGLSDVALRNISKKLGVPLPPLGFWAKRAAGKSPRVPPLPAHHQGPARHVRSVWIDERASEREAREAALLAKQRPAIWPVVVVPDSAEHLHAVVARTARRMGSSTRKQMLAAQGNDVFPVTVSPQQKARALRILDGIIRSLTAAGAMLVPSKPGGSPLHLEVLGQFVSIRIDELFDRTLRDPTAKEAAEQQRYSWMKPDLRVYTPNGELKLTAVSANRDSPYFTISDGIHTPLEQRLDGLVERIWAKTVQASVDEAMREEERRRWEEAHRRRAALEAMRREQLACLEAVEKALQAWDRARRLREFACALEASGSALTHGEVTADGAWVRNAADWLDPLCEKSWPAVDGEPAH